MGPKFFETRMGKTFYEATMPNLVAELKQINTTLLVVAKALDGVPLADRAPGGNDGPPGVDPHPLAEDYPGQRITGPEDAPRGELFDDAAALLGDVLSAFEGEEDSVQREHAALIERLRDALADQPRRINQRYDAAAALLVASTRLLDHEGRDSRHRAPAHERALDGLRAAVAACEELV